MVQLFSFAALKVSPLLVSNPRAIGCAIDPDVRDLRPLTEPEAPLEIEFVGLTDAEQRAALAAFPGGRRFHLAGAPALS